MSIFPNRKCLFYLPVFFLWSGFFLFASLFTFIVIVPGYGRFDVGNGISCIRPLEYRQPDDKVNIDRDFFNYMANGLRNSAYPGVENYTRYSIARLNLAPLAKVEPLKPDFGPVVNDVTSFRYPITIPQCRNVTDNRSIFIAVISAPNYFEKREMIRSTWTDHLQSYDHLMTVVGFAFIVGLTEDDATQHMIEEESRSFGDIIQIEMNDFYRNLAMKVAGLLNWVYLNCAQVDYVLKADDDVYVNVHNLVYFVHSYYGQSNYSLFGAKFNDYPPHRGTNKWSITYEEWPWKKYPIFSSGPSYIMPGSSILPLLAACQTTPLLPFEDVYLLGLCAEKAKVKIRASSSVLTRDMPLVPPACSLRLSISWLTTSNDHMNNSHIATDNFYQNVTQCILDEWDKIEEKNKTRTVDFTEPVTFSFVFRETKKVIKKSRNKKEKKKIAKKKA